MSHTISNATDDGDQIGQQQQEQEGALEGIEDHMNRNGSINAIGGVNSEMGMSPRVSTIGMDTEVSKIGRAHV